MKRYIRSSLVDEFLKYHEDGENYNRNPEGFNKVYDILDKYTDDLNEPVDVTFVKATPKDQMRMVSLIRPR